MNKFAILFTCVLASTCLSAQKRAVPAAEQIARVANTTTCVVLTGENMLLDAALREAVTNQWTLTPVVFIDRAAFEKTMGDANRTFLLAVNGTFKKDTEQQGYVFLNFLMGGSDKLEQLADFILLPIACENRDDEQSIDLMPAFVNIVQQHLQNIQRDPRIVRRQLDHYNMQLTLLRGRRLQLQSDDLGYDTTPAELQAASGGTIVLRNSEQDYDNLPDTDNAVVGFTLHPEGGAYGYNMLIDTTTSELLYFSRHRVKAAGRKGFTKNEIRLFCHHLQNK